MSIETIQTGAGAALREIQAAAKMLEAVEASSTLHLARDLMDEAYGRIRRAKAQIEMGLRE
jgi:hypothetical protein